MKSILIIDSDVAICTLLSRFLTRQQYQVKTCISGKAALDVLRQQSFHLIFCDCNLTGMDTAELIQKAKILRPEVKIIFTAENTEIKTAVDLIKSGADNYLSKPIYPDELLQCIKTTLETRESDTGNAKDKIKTGFILPSVDYVMGESKKARELYRNVNIVAPTNYSVIIYGETGTGKESLARLLHNQSRHADGPFIAIDCGSLSKELAASELFGHEKGAFTGALHAKTGAFEMASGGTLFLDEIGNLNYDIQTSLLRAIQEKVIRKVGGVKEVSIDVRFIVASNESLPEMVHKGTFREDLYYRLNEFELIVPPLRERTNDLTAFITTFLNECNRELQKNIPGIEPSVLEVLKKYTWPGNIRELKNTIRRACLLTPEGQMIKRKAFPPELFNIINIPLVHTALVANEQNISNIKSDQNINSDLKDAAQRAEHSRIVQVLKYVKYNKTKAAALLNIDRKTLYNKLKFITL